MLFLQLYEVFGAGTACIVSPVDGLVYKGKRVAIPCPVDDSSVSMRCYKELSDIQVTFHFSFSTLHPPCQYAI